MNSCPWGQQKSKTSVLFRLYLHRGVAPWGQIPIVRITVGSALLTVPRKTPGPIVLVPLSRSSRTRHPIEGADTGLLCYCSAISPSAPTDKLYEQQSWSVSFTSLLGDDLNCYRLPSRCTSTGHSAIRSGHAECARKSCNVRTHGNPLRRLTERKPYRALFALVPRELGDDHDGKCSGVAGPPNSRKGYGHP